LHKLHKVAGFPAEPDHPTSGCHLLSCVMHQENWLGFIAFYASCCCQSATFMKWLLAETDQRHLI
jgi:hypothetical protein